MIPNQESQLYWVPSTGTWDPSVIRACTEAMPPSLRSSWAPHQLLPLPFVLHIAPGCVQVQRASSNERDAPFNTWDLVWGSTTTSSLASHSHSQVHAQGQAHAQAPPQGPFQAPPPPPPPPAMSAQQPPSVGSTPSHVRSPTYDLQDSPATWFPSATPMMFSSSGRTPSSLSSHSEGGSRPSSVLSTHSYASYHSSDCESLHQQEPLSALVSSAIPVEAGEQPGDESILRQTATDLGLLNFMAGCDESMIQRFGTNEDDPSERSADLTITGILPLARSNEPDTPAARRAFFSADTNGGGGAAARPTAMHLGATPTSKRASNPGTTTRRMTPPAPLNMSGSVAPAPARMSAEYHHHHHQPEPNQRLAPSQQASPTRRAHPSRSSAGRVRRDPNQVHHQTSSSSLSSTASSISTSYVPSDEEPTTTITATNQEKGVGDEDKRKLQVYDKGNVHVLGGGVKLGVAATTTNSSNSSFSHHHRQQHQQHHQHRSQRSLHASQHPPQHHHHHRQQLQQQQRHHRAKSSGDVLINHHRNRVPLPGDAIATSVSGTGAASGRSKMSVGPGGHGHHSSGSLRAGAAQWYPRSFGNEGGARVNRSTPIVPGAPGPGALHPPQHGCSPAKSSSVAALIPKKSTTALGDGTGSGAGSGAMGEPYAAKAAVVTTEAPNAVTAAMANSLSTGTATMPILTAGPHPQQQEALPTFLAEQAEQYLRSQMAHRRPQHGGGRKPGHRNSRSWVAA